MKDTVIVKFRKPGEKMILPPNTVWEKSLCRNQKLPFISIVQYQVIPVSVKPGNSFSQRLTYSLCSNDRGDEILGSLYTRITFRGSPVISDVDSNHTMKPGKWRLDRIIDIPSDATPGVYSIELEFKSLALKFKKQENLVIEN